MSDGGLSAGVCGSRRRGDGGARVGAGGTDTGGGRTGGGGKLAIIERMFRRGDVTLIGEINGGGDAEIPEVVGLGWRGEDGEVKFAEMRKLPPLCGDAGRVVGAAAAFQRGDEGGDVDEVVVDAASSL